MNTVLCCTATRCLLAGVNRDNEIKIEKPLFVTALFENSCFGLYYKPVNFCIFFCQTLLVLLTFSDDLVVMFDYLCTPFTLRTRVQN